MPANHTHPLSTTPEDHLLLVRREALRRLYEHSGMSVVTGARDRRGAVPAQFRFVGQQNAMLRYNPIRKFTGF